MGKCANVENEYYVGDAMTLYLKDIKGLQVLTAEEEVELAKAMKQDGEEGLKAREAFIKANLRFVMFCAKDYLDKGVALEDLNSLGIEGLMKAVDKFDYTKGFRFATYAVWWINQSITRGIEKNLVKADNTDSLDRKIGEDGETSLEELLMDEKAVEPCEYVVANDSKCVLEKVLSQLDAKEALVLKLHYGIGVKEKMTLEEIGRLPQMNVTKERVRQIEQKALKKIRQNDVWFRQLREVAYER